MYSCPFFIALMVSIRIVCPQSLRGMQVQRKLIYDNAFFSYILHLFGKSFLKVARWQVIGKPPADKKYVVIAGPHTSNWDFPLFMAVAGYFRLRPSFLGKDTLFTSPLGRMFYYLGGIPVYREGPEAKDVVAQAIDSFEEQDELVLGIAPEGTRSKVDKLKSGFYRIAEGAEVPIHMAYLDGDKRIIGFGPRFVPTGDMEADLQQIYEFYASKPGVNKLNN